MPDAPLQRNVVEELLWDPRIDSETIAVSADDHGKVTLRGTVGSLRQQREAKKATERDAKLDADNLTVAISGGTVTLSGTVRSWSEHDAAVAVAWAAPGITAVHDHLTLSY
jgi:osmotically-inducible protein OsmY